MNILIIAPSWIGDFIISNSLYKVLKKKYPNCIIDVLATEWIFPLLSLMPEINNGILMPIGHGKLSIKTRYNLGKSLKGKYEKVIVLPNSLKSALIPFFAKIPSRVGYIGEYRYFLLNDLHTLDINKHPLLVQRFNALAYSKIELKQSNMKVEIPYPSLNIPKNIIDDSIDFICKNINLNINNKLIGFCPGAEFGPAKCWPDYHYRNLAELLIKKEFNIIFFGSYKDKKIIENIIIKIDKDLQKYCINIAGITNLVQSSVLISKCKGLVTNDSGLMHIASALNIPLVALYGPTNPKYTPPLSNNAKIIRLIDGFIKIRKSKDSKEGYHKSLIDITPKMVMEQLNTLI